MEKNWPKAWPNVVISVDEIHIFDPNGDVLLQLQKTIPVKAPKIGETTPLPDESPGLEVADKEYVTTVETYVTTAETSPLEPPVYEDSLDSQPPTWTEEDVVVEEGTPQLGLEDELTLNSTLNVYLRVSSRHLILASAMFNTMLGSDAFPEGRELRSEGNLVVKLSDNPKELIILMYIVHGMTRKIPRNIPLYPLAEIAHLVNYYKLHEAVELYSDMWIANLKQKNFPTSYNPEVVLPWLFISWVFQKKYEFEKMTQILIYESDNELQNDVDSKGILIPASIVNRIQESRTEAIERTITVVHDHITRYFTSDILCSNYRQFACDAIALGSLLKSSATIGIWPRPEAPYHGITFRNLASQVREMQVLDDCTQRDMHFGSGYGHGIKDAIGASIRSLEDQFCGLKLDSFLPETQNKKKCKADKKKIGRKKQNKKEKGSMTWVRTNTPLTSRIRVSRVRGQI